MISLISAEFLSTKLLGLANLFVFIASLTLSFKYPHFVDGMYFVIGFFLMEVGIVLLNMRFIYKIDPDRIEFTDGKEGFNHLWTLTKTGYPDDPCAITDWATNS